MFIIINVVNKYHGGTGEYIGRGSPLGNKFKIGEHGTREEVIALYKAWILEQIRLNNPIVINELNRLASIVMDDRKPLNLVCFCHPQACHGDVIKAILVEAIRKHRRDQTNGNICSA